MEIIHDHISNDNHRKITDTYTLGAYRVKVYTYHDKDKKAYWSIIKECIVEPSGTTGIYFEKYRFHNDLNKIINSAIASRYNYQHLISHHNKALYMVRELVDQLLEREKENEIRICELCGSNEWRILHAGDESNCECEGECLRVCDSTILSDDGCDGVAILVNKVSA
jgi:hypothetical protein